MEAGGGGVKGAIKDASKDAEAAESKRRERANMEAQPSTRSTGLESCTACGGKHQRQGKQKKKECHWPLPGRGAPRLGASPALGSGVAQWRHGGSRRGARPLARRAPATPNAPPFALAPVYHAQPTETAPQSERGAGLEELGAGLIRGGG